jgi:aminoglycoside phosphotransferase (APT) family kinase protein
MTEKLLTKASVLNYLRARGIIGESAAEARLLGGGVSNVVIAVTQGEKRLVLKQALPKLRVETEWLAPVERVITEGKAIDVASRILGTGAVLRDSDDSRFTITMDRADDGWGDWKSILFAHTVQAKTAAEVGRQIALIHGNTRGGEDLDSDFFRTEPFELLRLAPYYLATAAAAPAQAQRILYLAEELRTRRECLVHGDLSPKNILVGTSPDQVWLIDWEVAHYGDPSFDLAFVITHLTMKSIHFPQDRSALDASGDAFTATYEAVKTGPPPEWDRVIAHVGCLLMARVLGKSPAEYLDARGRAAVLEVGRTLVQSSSNNLTDLRTLRDRFIK